MKCTQTQVGPFTIAAAAPGSSSNLLPSRAVPWETGAGVKEGCGGGAEQRLQPWALGLKWTLAPGAPPQVVKARGVPAGTHLVWVRGAWWAR